MPVALLWFQLFPEKANKKQKWITSGGALFYSLQTAESLSTFASLVVEVTCLLSVLSMPSASSPGDSPGEALVFFRSRLDLHWISVSRPASSDGIIVMSTKHLSSHIKPLWNNITTYTSMLIGFLFSIFLYWMSLENLSYFFGFTHFLKNNTQYCYTILQAQLN